MTVTPRAASPVDFDAYKPYMPKASGDEPTVKRPLPAFRNRITEDGSSGALSEPGRYHLYTAYPCPFSQRSMIVHALKGLESVVSLSILDPIRDSRGWAFRKGEGHGLDEINGFAFLREAYEATEPNYNGHVSVPALWDKTTHRIASNDYRVLDIDLATQFDKWAKNDIDIYPVELRAEIDSLNGFLFERVHDGPYRCGFASSQQGYEREVQTLFAALDQLEDRLANRRYLIGDRITVSDIRLWVTLARFDVVYVTHFKTNLRRIVDYPNLWRFTRDLYQHEAFRQTTNFDHIKRHYYITHSWLNPSMIVSLGPDLDWTTAGTNTVDLSDLPHSPGDIRS